MPSQDINGVTYSPTKQETEHQEFAASGCRVMLLWDCCSLLLFELGIAKIVMGAVYLHDCSIENRIPVYLIVSAIVPILLAGFRRQVENDGQGGLCNNLCGTVYSIIGFLFSLIWFICGSIWVNPYYAKVMADGFSPCTANKTTDCTVGDCNRSLMKFAFGMVTFDWIFMGLWVVKS